MYSSSVVSISSDLEESEAAPPGRTNPYAKRREIDLQGACNTIMQVKITVMYLSIISDGKKRGQKQRDSKISSTSVILIKD